MKRVLCLLSSMNAGGAETFLMKIYREIDRTKYQMDFCINVKEKGFYDDEIRKLGGNIFVIPSKSESLLEFKRQLTNIIKENKYEYVMRITSSAMGFLDLKIAKKAGAKICVARSSNSSDGDSLISYMAHRVGRFLYSGYVDVKIAPSDLAAIYTFGEKKYKTNQVKILHNAVNLDLFGFDIKGRESVRNELGIQKKNKVVGHVGRFAMQKNHTFLLDIFKEIHKMDSDARLLLVGKGELEESVKKKAQELEINDAIIFAGVRKDIPKILSAMDIFVFPSLYEGMPNTVIEAQATGLPCVVSDTITKEANITGLVSYLPLDSPKAWAEASLRLFEADRKDTSQLFIEKKYDIKSVADEFVTIIFGE